MSAEMVTPPTGRSSAERPITVDDLKHQALRIRDTAEAEVRTQLEGQAARNIAIVAGVVLLAVGFAYFMGSRRAPVCPEPPFPPYPPPYR